MKEIKKVRFLQFSRRVRKTIKSPPVEIPWIKLLSLCLRKFRRLWAPSVNVPSANLYLCYSQVWFFCLLVLFLQVCFVSSVSMFFMELGMQFLIYRRYQVLVTKLFIVCDKAAKLKTSCKQNTSLRQFFKHVTTHHKHVKNTSQIFTMAIHRNSTRRTRRKFFYVNK